MRKVYVVPKDQPIEEARAEAEALGIGEIVHGVPPRVARATGITDIKSPMVYDEPELVPVKSELEQLIDRVTELEKGTSSRG